MKVLPRNAEKRMIGDTGYEVIQSIPIGGKEILLAENMAAEDGLHYLVCDYQRYGLLGEYSHVRKSEDYLELLKTFSHRIGYDVEKLQTQQIELGLLTKPFTAEHCHPHSYSESIEGKVIAIKPEVVNPEYRGYAQMMLVIGGFGARGNARGRAVYCVELDTGSHVRFDRSDVLGVVKELPDWAKARLAKIQADRERPVEKEYAGRYEIVKRIEAGERVFALGHNPGAVQPYGTWLGVVDEDSKKTSYMQGNYFRALEAAENNLQERAALWRGPAWDQSQSVQASDLSPAGLSDVSKSEQPIYKFPFEIARDKGELEAYHRSKQLNIECGRAIDQAIAASNYEPNYYDLKTAACTVIADYGAKRVAWVLASNVKEAQWDGRLSRTTKAWAQAFDVSDSLPEKPDVYLQSHRTLIDGFVDRFRELEREKPSLMATLKAGAKKSAEQFDVVPVADARQRGVDREVS